MFSDTGGSGIPGLVVEGPKRWYNSARPRWVRMLYVLEGQPMQRISSGARHTNNTHTHWGHPIIGEEHFVHVVTQCGLFVQPTKVNVGGAEAYQLKRVWAAGRG